MLLTDKFFTLLFLSQTNHPCIKNNSDINITHTKKVAYLSLFCSLLIKKTQYNTEMELIKRFSVVITTRGSLRGSQLHINYECDVIAISFLKIEI